MMQCTSHSLSITLVGWVVLSLEDMKSTTVGHNISHEDSKVSRDQELLEFSQIWSIPLVRWREQFGTNMPCPFLWRKPKQVSSPRRWENSQKKGKPKSRWSVSKTLSRKQHEDNLIRNTNLDCLTCLPVLIQHSQLLLSNTRKRHKM